MNSQADKDGKQNNFDGLTGLPVKSLGFGEDGQAKGWWPSAEREARVNEGYLFHICCKQHNLHRQHRILTKLHQQLCFEVDFFTADRAPKNDMHQARAAFCTDKNGY